VVAFRPCPPGAEEIPDRNLGGSSAHRGSRGSRASSNPGDPDGVHPDATPRCPDGAGRDRGSDRPIAGPNGGRSDGPIDPIGDPTVARIGAVSGACRACSCRATDHGDPFSTSLQTASAHSTSRNGNLGKADWLSIAPSPARVAQVSAVWVHSSSCGSEGIRRAPRRAHRGAVPFRPVGSRTAICRLTAWAQIQGIARHAWRRSTSNTGQSRRI